VNGIAERSINGNGFFSRRIDIYSIQNAPIGEMAKRATYASKIAGLLSGAGPRVIRRKAAAIATKPPAI